MEKVSIELSFEADKLEALEYCLQKERTTVKRRWQSRSSNSMRRRCRRQCGNIWTGRTRQLPGPGVRVLKNRLERRKLPLNRERNSIMNENEITVLKVEPGKAPEQITIPNTLRAMQELVSGHIEIVDYQGHAWCVTRKEKCWDWSRIEGSVRT